eukprot:TRINITY_DN51783_c0_g1_i1.p1 TRINITY_DN51783_c0_g1~~TRINITY_DN51783_c0_g1_i1.p1  ORF type:complete len:274 (-),score=67.23 TRINITY_DN51783_c0_g1_i1:41-862(-)
MESTLHAALLALCVLYGLADTDTARSAESDAPGSDDDGDHVWISQDQGLADVVSRARSALEEGQGAEDIRQGVEDIGQILGQGVEDIFKGLAGMKQGLGGSEANPLGKLGAALGDGLSKLICTHQDFKAAEEAVRRSCVESSVLQSTSAKARVCSDFACQQATCALQTAMRDHCGEFYVTLADQMSKVVEQRCGVPLSCGGGSYLGYLFIIVLLAAAAVYASAGGSSVQKAGAGGMTAGATAAASTEELRRRRLERFSGAAGAAAAERTSVQD